ncbi:hypothetical protein [Streptomyces sp. NPDC055189]
MWRYGVGHSQLLFRSTPENTESTCLDLHFEGVAAVQLGIRYVSPRLRLADRQERATLKTLAHGETGAGRGRGPVAIAIESDSGGGLVLCSRVRALRSGAEPLGSIGESEILWSHPPGRFWGAPLTEAVWAELSGPVRAAIAKSDAERLELERSRLAVGLRPTLTEPVYSLSARFAHWERLVRRLERPRDATNDPYPVVAYGNDLGSRDALTEAMARLPLTESPLKQLLTALDTRFDAATTPDPEGSLRPWVHPQAKPQTELARWWTRKPLHEPWD